MPSDLNPEEKRVVQTVFNYFDNHGVGEISLDQMGQAMKQLMPSVDPTEVQNFVRDADVNQDGRVSYNEFYDYIRRKWLGIGSEKDILQAFSVIDEDKSGYISPAELRFLLTSVGDNPLTEDEADELIHLADMDGDGLISYAEFFSTLQK